jgi:hypothetical protein
MMAFRGCGMVVLLLGLAAPATPCSVRALTKPADLLKLATVIVRARADRLSTVPGQGGNLAAASTQVEFTVLSVLKGRHLGSTLTFNGVLSERDERNPGTIPYQTARHSADGECFAMGYREGGYYLLFLKRGDHPAYAQGQMWTPYWAPLAPSNEQLFGADDPWERWVSERLRISDIN